VTSPREILVHLNVTVPPSDARSADEIADYLLAALGVGLEGAPEDWVSGHYLTFRSSASSLTDGALTVVCPMAEEV
jgi:hypothetical protein